MRHHGGNETRGSEQLSDGQAARVASQRRESRKHIRTAVGECEKGNARLQFVQGEPRACAPKERKETDDALAESESAGDMTEVGTEEFAGANADEREEEDEPDRHERKDADAVRSRRRLHVQPQPVDERL